MAGIQSPLKGPGSFWGFNAQICILPHSRDSFLSFLTASSTPKTNKNSTSHCNSINLRYFIYYTHFLIFMKKVCI